MSQTTKISPLPFWIQDWSTLPICYSTLFELLHLLLGLLFFFGKHGRKIILSRPPLITILLSSSLPLTSNDIILVMVKLTALSPTSLCSHLPLLLIKQQIRKLKLFLLQKETFLSITTKVSETFNKSAHASVFKLEPATLTWC